MIDFKIIAVGDKVKVVGAGAPGFANLGDELKITKVQSDHVYAQRPDGEGALFALTCGAARLELIAPSDNDGGVLEGRNRTTLPGLRSTGVLCGYPTKESEMGMFDRVMVPCPKCGAESEFQSKGGDCNLTTYSLANCPPDVLSDVNRHAPNTCDECETMFAVQVTWTACAVPHNI